MSDIHSGNVTRDNTDRRVYVFKMTGRKRTTSRSTCNHVKVFRLLKVTGLSFLLIFLLLLVTALVRTLTFDTNAGLQLALWEKREQIPPQISQLERQQLIARFKGTVVK